MRETRDEIYRKVIEFTFLFFNYSPKAYRTRFRVIYDNNGLSGTPQLFSRRPKKKKKLEPELRNHCNSINAGMGKFRVKIRDDLIGFDVTFAFLIYAAVKIARTEPANRRENSAEFAIRDKEKEF